MGKPLVIFGLTTAAEMAHHFFSLEAEMEVAAMTADRAYIEEAHWNGLPVVPFEELAASHPPARYDLFVAVGYNRLNTVRHAKIEAALAMGYTLASYVSPRAHVSKNAVIGSNCLVMEGAVVQAFARLGCGVVLWSGAHVAHHSSVGDCCFLGPCAVVAGNVEIGAGCFVGANATLRDSIRIGAGCVIGAGAIMLADADPGGVYAAHGAERSPVPARQGEVWCGRRSGRDN